MADLFYDDTRDAFAKCLESLSRDLGKMRTGRASLAILDGIRVDYYGSPTPVTQVASCNVADPRLITIKPWDRTMLGTIEKALLNSDIGITPGSDGTLIRLPIPPLTGERRRDLVKQSRSRGEEAKVAIRNLRRDTKELIEDSDLPEDDAHRQLRNLQELTDDYIKKVDTVITAKEAEIMGD
ncbi:MAG: ribosome recycling factor [Deltaproteobacteria bacterium]|nr:ribosome recycling factor [Deltaproteobacteria bacterium]